MCVSSRHLWRLAIVRNQETIEIYLVYVPNHGQRGRSWRKIFGPPTNPQDRQAADGHNYQDGQVDECHDEDNRCTVQRSILESSRSENSGHTLNVAATAGGGKGHLCLYSIVAVRSDCVPNHYCA
jgi:hypothetical protein